MRFITYVGWHVLPDRRTVNEPQAESKWVSLSLSLCSGAERGVVCTVNFHLYTRRYATVRLEINDNQDVIKGDSHAAVLGFIAPRGERINPSIYPSWGARRGSCDNRTRELRHG